MNRFRRIFPLIVVIIAMGAVAYAVSFGTLPPADLTYNNEDEIKTIDPALATGHPENRIINAVFEGLLRLMPVKDAAPNEDGVVPLVPAPAVADLPEISADGKEYVFRFRDNAKWSNGDPVTPQDFVWSWRRTLHPETASEYSYQLHYIVGAKKYTNAEVEPGDQVEVELKDRKDPLQAFPRGTIVRGILRDIKKQVAPHYPESISKEKREQTESDWRRRWVYVVEEKGRGDEAIDWEGKGKLRAFSKSPNERQVGDLPVESCLQILPNFETTVGVQATDAKTLVVKLNNPTPFFAELTAFYPLYPVHPPTVQKYGSPYWTKPGKVVGNGPFLLEFRRIRDRIRLRKNPMYWDAENVQLNVVDAMAVKLETTSLNMFLKGQLDWITKPPSTVLDQVKTLPQYRPAPALITYFYRYNVARKPMNDVRVRQALNLAIDKQEICDHVTKAGQRPAGSLVPPGMPGYRSPMCGQFNPERAKQLLAEAGYENMDSFPKIEILYNTNEGHQAIAEAIQQHWRRLGIDCELRNLEWGTYLDTVHKTDFDVARAGWVPDYSDPNTFLDMFVTGGPQNNTNWSNAEYDRLIAAAGAEPDTQKRIQLMYQAEEILVTELPIIPIYYYVSTNMVNDRVVNFHPNYQDTYPLHTFRVKDLRAPATATAGK